MGRPRSRAPAVSWIAPALAGKPAEERQATPTEVLLQDKSGSSKSPARAYYMNKPLRILILEDQPADAELVTCELRKAGLEFVAKTVATENEFLAELRNSAPELILSEYGLPRDLRFSPPRRSTS